MKYILILTLSMFCSFSCFASNNGYETTHLGDFVSESGESLESFMIKVAPNLEEYTKKTGYEACGAIASDGERFSIQLFSDNVPQGCAIRTSAVMDGFTFINETLHSHPWQQLLRIDSKAKAWGEAHGMRLQADTLRNDGRSGFSRQDLSTGLNSWLVAGGKLHYANPKEKIRKTYPLP